MAASMQNNAKVDSLDDWFGFTTTKTVYIRDRKLGFIYYGLVALVLLFILFVQILYQNNQFILRPVDGISRVKVTQPTEGLCDTSLPDCKSAYRSLEQLPYCTAYTGDKPLKHQGPCKFEDALSIIPNGEVDNKIFIPTAIEIVTERKTRRPGPKNDYTSTNEYEEIPGTDCLNGGNQCTRRGGLKNQFYYVADTRNFQVQFVSSYEQGEVHGTSLDHPAYYEVCDPRVQEAHETHQWEERLQHSSSSEGRCDGSNVRHEAVPCAPGQLCTQRRDFDFWKDSGVGATLWDSGKDSVNKTHVAMNETKGELPGHGRAKSTRQKFLGTSHGHLDFSTDPSYSGVDSKKKTSGEAAKKVTVGGQWSSPFGDVFTLDRLMELAGTDLDKNFNMDGWSIRESGTVLEVSIVYKNLHPFLSTFGYKDVEYFYRVKELPLPSFSRQQLSTEQPSDYPETRRYEIRHGIMIWFKVQAFALIGAASAITNAVAIYAHNRKNNYFNLKYEISGDFCEMWQCEQCHYWNNRMHDTCQSYPMWQNSEEAPRCGAPQPTYDACAS